MQVDGSGHSTSPIDWVDLRRWISGGEKELGVDGSTGREEWHMGAESRVRGVLLGIQGVFW